MNAKERALLATTGFESLEDLIKSTKYTTKQVMETLCPDTTNDHSDYGRSEAWYACVAALDECWPEWRTTPKIIKPINELNFGYEVAARIKELYQKAFA